MDIPLSQGTSLMSFGFREEAGKRAVVAGSESKNTVSYGVGSDHRGGK